MKKPKFFLQISLAVQICLFVCLFVGASLTQLSAQTSEKPFMAELSAKFLDYNGPLYGSYGLYKQFDPGISIAAHAFLTPAMNLSLTSSFVPETSYPMTEASIISTSLIDVNALLTFKSNGTFLREDALFAPYVAVGGGLNTASNNLRFYAPAALGVRMQVSKNFSLQVQAMYKQKFVADQIQPMSYSAGFVFSLPTEEKVPKIDQEEEDFPAPLANLPDRDQDGVLDRDDLCPDEKGKAMYLGCPEENAPEPAISDPSPTDVADSPITPSTSSSAPAYVMEEPEVKETYGDVGRVDEIIPITSADQEALNRAMENIYFEPASDELTFSSYAVLDEVAELLNKYPDYNLEVLGHTDNRGSREENIILSIKRAFKVKYYLVYQRGISIARISSDGYSASKPLMTNETEEGRAHNRRVELKLVPNNSNNRIIRANK